jgi:hypothetical protein
MVEFDDHAVGGHGESAPRSRREALRLLLSDGDWHASYECADVGGVSFQSAIYTFRRSGWKVEARRVHGHLYEYRISGRGRAAPRQTRLSRPQLAVLRDVFLAVCKVYGDEGAERVRASLPPRLHEEARRL